VARGGRPGGVSIRPRAVPQCWAVAPRGRAAAVDHSGPSNAMVLGGGGSAGGGQRLAEVAWRAMAQRQKKFRYAAVTMGRRSRYKFLKFIRDHYIFVG
jgi:hypothetical protein